MNNLNSLAVFASIGVMVVAYSSITTDRSLVKLNSHQNNEIYKLREFDEQHDELLDRTLDIVNELVSRVKALEETCATAVSL